MFEALSRELLNGGLYVRFEARGASMSPSIHDREIVHVTPVIVSKLGKGDIVLTKGDSGFRMHRLVIADHKKDTFITRGDCGLEDDPPLPGAQILGFAATKEVKVAGRVFTVTLDRRASRARRIVGRARWIQVLPALASSPGLELRLSPSTTPQLTLRIGS